MAIKKGLGKGLGALIERAEYVQDNVQGVIEVDLHEIEPGVTQPRKYFNDEALKELATSIKEHGIIQPLIVKKELDYYSIIAGERRFRAARIAGLKKVPVIVKDYNEGEMLQIALIENLQREDLNPIEEALCYKKLMDEYLFRQEDISVKVGKSRSSISNMLNLLNLSKTVQDLIIENKINKNHGKVLLNVKDKKEQATIAREIAERGMSVSESEKLVNNYLSKNQSSQVAKHKPKLKNNYLYIENDLKEFLGTKVNIKDGKNKGKIEIEYYSGDDLDRIIKTLKGINL